MTPSVVGRLRVLEEAMRAEGFMLWKDVAAIRADVEACARALRWGDGPVIDFAEVAARLALEET